MKTKLFPVMAALAVLFAGERGYASTLSAAQNLSFGTLVPVSSSGNVTVSTAGALNTGGNVTVAPSGTAAYQGIVRFTPALLDVFTFSVVESQITLTNTVAGGGTVTIDNFTLSPSSLNINVLASSNVNVGARLRFFSTSLAGTYTGTVTVRTSGVLDGTTSVSLPVTMTLWRALSISESQYMSFGGLETSSGASVVRLRPQSGAVGVVSGSSNVSVSSSPASSAGKFDIGGQPNTQVSVSLPSSITLTASGGGSMTVNNFTSYPSENVTLDATGAKSLYVGADLNIAANQPSGSYSGTYVITVNY